MFAWIGITVYIRFRCNLLWLMIQRLNTDSCIDSRNCCFLSVNKIAMTY